MPLVGDPNPAPAIHWFVKSPKADAFPFDEKVTYSILLSKWVTAIPP